MVHCLLGSLLGLVAVGEFSFVGFEEVARKLVVHHIFFWSGITIFWVPWASRRGREGNLYHWDCRVPLRKLGSGTYLPFGVSGSY